MYHFILQILIMSSLAVVVYMVARKVPQISDTLIEEDMAKSQGFWKKIDNYISSLPLEKMDFAISQFLEKMIRKLKLILMRTDNHLTHHLERFKKIKHKALRHSEPKKFELYEEMKNEKESEVDKEIKEELLKAVKENQEAEAIAKREEVEQN